MGGIRGIRLHSCLMYHFHQHLLKQYGERANLFVMILDNAHRDAELVSPDVVSYIGNGHLIAGRPVALHHLETPCVSPPSARLDNIFDTWQGFPLLGGCSGQKNNFSIGRKGLFL